MPCTRFAITATRGAARGPGRWTGHRYPVPSATVIQAASTTPTVVHILALAPTSPTPRAIPGPIATAPGSTLGRSGSRNPTASGSAAEEPRKLDPCLRFSLSQWYRCSLPDSRCRRPSPRPRAQRSATPPRRSMPPRGVPALGGLAQHASEAGGQAEGGEGALPGVKRGPGTAAPPSAPIWLSAPIWMSDDQGSDGRNRGIDRVAFAAPSISDGRPHPRARCGQLPDFDTSGTRVSSHASSDLDVDSQMLSQ